MRRLTLGSVALVLAWWTVEGGGGWALGAAKPHAPKPHATNPPKPHAANPPKPHAAKPPKPHPGATHVAAKPHPTAAAGSAPRMLPGHLSHRGYAHHYQRSYRGRRYAHRNRTNAQLSAEMKHLIALKADLDAIAMGGQATPKQQGILNHDLLAVVEKGASRPAPEPLQQLSTTLADLVARKRKSPLATEPLVYDLDVVLNSPLATPAEVSQAISHGQSLFRSAGASRAEAETIASRLKAVTLNR